MEHLINSQCNHVCGSIYKSGNLVFHQQNLYSPVGNRVLRVDLEKNRSTLLRGECESDIRHVKISPDGRVLVAVCQSD